MSKILFLAISLVAVGLILLITRESSAQAPLFSQRSWQTMHGREEGKASERVLLYRFKTPPNWIRRDPLPSESLVDTMKPVCEFFIPAGAESIRLTIHTFPVSSEQPRIPPIAQVSRWKNQFEEYDPLSLQIIPQSRGGFIGLLLDVQGIIQGQNQHMLSWSMQLAPEYDRQLSASESFLDRQRRADYTIKVVASPTLIKKHRQMLLAFANTFELIEELPSPL
jgi:hypothetical protein